MERNSFHNNIDFEEYARTYLRAGNISNWRKYLLEEYISNSSIILDIGCGEGIYLEYLSKRIPKENLIGTDVSMIRVNRVNEKGFLCKKVQDNKLPFNDSKFDLIIFFEVIEHIASNQIEILLKEFVRVLKNGGIVIGSTPNYPVKRLYNYLNGMEIGFNLLKTRILNMMFKRSERHQQNQEKHLVGRTQIDQRSFIERIKRLFADDPTHQSHYNFSLIHSLGKKYFKEVKLFTTFIDKARPIEPDNMLSYFSIRSALSRIAKR